MKLIKELNEGFSGLSVIGSDGASDLFYEVKKAAVKAIVPVLKAGLKDKGNTWNTPGALNVAMILTEKFKDWGVEGFSELSKIAEKCLSILEDDKNWAKHAGFKKIISDLREMT